MEEYRIVENPTDSEWREYCKLVNSDWMALYYATPEYLKMLESVVGGTILIYAYYQTGKMMMALPAMMKMGEAGPVMNSLPFFGSNPGFVIHDELRQFSGIKERLSEMVVRSMRGFAAATILNPPPSLFSLRSVIDEKNQLPNGFFVGAERIGAITALDVPVLMDSFHQKTRNMIRKAQKNEIKIREAEDSVRKMAILGMIRNHHRLNMQSIGGPVKPDEFFQSLVWKNFPGLSIYYATYQGDFAAGLIVFRKGAVAEYFMPVIVEGYRSFAPLNLLIYEAMQKENRKGASFWNWGGTTLPGMEGVYRFKKRFGAYTTNYHYYTIVNNPAILLQSPEWIMKQYPYFFVIPFDKLKMNEEKKDG